MTTRRLPIAGYPHLALAAHDDERLQAKIVAALRNAGYAIEAEQVVPPVGADGAAIIRAITAAFQAAKAR